MVAQRDSIKWTFNARRQEPAKFAALIIIIAIFAAVVYFTSDTARIWWTAVSVLLLVLMTLPYFVPISYELDDKGVAVYHGVVKSSFKPWSHYTRCVYDDFGLQFKTMVVESRLDQYRGCFMRLPGAMADRDEILKFISGRLKTERNVFFGKRKTGRRS